MACDGGGGPAGHPRIFINTDKPEISVCNYCGLPFVRREPLLTQIPCKPSLRANMHHVWQKLILW